MLGVSTAWLVAAGNSFGQEINPSFNAQKISVPLEYQESANAVASRNVSVTLQNAPFAKEPPAVSGKTLRGHLEFNSKATNCISFLWQQSEGRLFLDLNRDGDLTDDPAGAFSSASANHSSYQTFTNVHLGFDTAQGHLSVCADLLFWNYGSRPTCNLSLRSFWQGEINLNGRDYQIGLVPVALNPDKPADGARLLLRPWEKRNEAFNVFDGSLATVPYQNKLFINGQAAELDLQGAAVAGEWKPTVQLEKQVAALGSLKIDGKFIRRMVLSSGAYLVVLDQPADTVPVPTGSYAAPDVLLEQGGVAASCVHSSPRISKAVNVDGITPVILNIGGPLTNSVLASRRGPDLRLDYQLVGAGGMSYKLINQDRTHPPEFAVYKGENKLTSGNFEFG